MSKIQRRRKYDAEFKDQSVSLLLNSGKTVEVVAEELGVHYSVLSRWKRDYLERMETGESGTPAVSVDDENQRLRKELASVRSQRDILKKALSIFSQTNNEGSDS
jgi:transposase